MDTLSPRNKLDGLAKPIGSLGTLEDLAERLAVTQHSLKPKTRPRRLLLFAADHGVVNEGVGIWPSSVTTAMMTLIIKGRAASSALARATNTELTLIDVGSISPSSVDGDIAIDRRVCLGSANLAAEPALTPSAFDHAFRIGKEEAERAINEGCSVIAVGELGIGNTTPATCIVSLLTGADPGDLIGHGAGSTPETLARKRRVVVAATERARLLFQSDPVAAMAAVSGLEIVAVAGAIAAAAKARTTVVIDGLVTAAAALVARQLDPGALDTMIASHSGAEPAHAVALKELGTRGFLDWRLRLGEGTGALLLMPMLDSAAALLTDVATLAEVTGKTPL